MSWQDHNANRDVFLFYLQFLFEECFDHWAALCKGFILFIACNQYWHFWNARITQYSVQIAVEWKHKSISHCLHKKCSNQKSYSATSRMSFCTVTLSMTKMIPFAVVLYWSKKRPRNLSWPGMSNTRSVAPLSSFTYSPMFSAIDVNVSLTTLCNICENNKVLPDSQRPVRRMSVRFWDFFFHKKYNTKSKKSYQMEN